MSYKARKGKFKWIIVNKYGNFWDGKAFVISRNKAKVYLTHGKAVIAHGKAVASLAYKPDRFYVELEKVVIEPQLKSYAEWLQEEYPEN